MKNHLHSITNALHQISGYTTLLRRHPEKLNEYADVIETNSRYIDKMLQDLFQNHIIDSLPSPVHLNIVGVADGKKVLIVDDIAENRDILHDIFITLRCDVQSASCGLEAIDIAKRFRPDLILMDIMMPEMDGYETATQLRNQNRSATIIAISALREDSNATQFDAWLTKPFRTNHIITLLASLGLHNEETKEVDIELVGLSPEFCRDLLCALNKGALSHCEKLVEGLEDGKNKRWLIERLSMIDFSTIDAALQLQLQSEYP